MRTLLVLRGAPGCGKSTWVEKNGLLPYTLCPDTLRIMCSSRELNADGHFSIARNNATEKQTWKIIMDLLEYRMSRGELTVLDATASKTKDIQQYKELAEQYRYRTYVVDFTDVPLETCLAQNKQRHPDKWVPEESIRNIYARFANQPVPSRVEVIKPDELGKILEKYIDLSNYKKVVFVGDIHGCYDTLMQYPDFKEGLKDDTAYIFTGDYVDRGNQNAEVMLYLYSIMDRPNVCFLEGNHERWIRDYGNSAPAQSREFELKTKPQFIAGGFTEKHARMFYRKVRQFSHFMWNGLEILACHGGVPHINTNLIYMPTTAFINGVGTYAEYQTIADTWMTETADNQFLVHGHRNTEKDPIQIADRVFNLEGGVEFGGSLRIAELENIGSYPEYGITADGGRIPVGMNVMYKWNTVELADCQPITEDLITENRPVETIEDAVTYLRNNKFVTEKPLGDDISSFNFSRDAFYSANWNRQTILARGLFIDTKNNKIMARSYEKFFKINEVRETELAALKSRLQYPVRAFVKENGFLAIVSYDYNKDDLFVASKSTNKGDFVGYIREQLEPYYEHILRRLRYYHECGSPMTFVFECVDIDHDPHIIKYKESKLVLLDAIFNTLNFESTNYDNLKYIASQIGCPVKEVAYIINNWEDFRDLYMEAQDEEYQFNGEYIEGFVFEDANGFMTKCKTGYYNFWKFMRSVADITLKCGHYRRTGALQNAMSNNFYGFCQRCFKEDRRAETKDYPYKTDIISLRDKFLNN